jgi:hypothetical protein
MGKSKNKALAQALVAEATKIKATITPPHRHGSTIQSCFFSKLFGTNMGRWVANRLLVDRKFWRVGCAPDVRHSVAFSVIAQGSFLCDAVA